MNTSTTLLIIGTVVLLAFWIFWIINMARNRQQAPDRKPFETNQLYDFETAPEASIYPEDTTVVPPNDIKLSGDDAANLIASWGVEREMLDKAAQELGIEIDPMDLVLRLYESSDQVRFHDIPIKAMQGSCRLQLQPQNAYYVSLGAMDNTRFIPILTSNTVIKHN